MWRIVPVLFLFSCFLPFYSSGQSQLPVKIAVSNEATAVPFTRFFTTPIHPAIQIGTEFLYAEGAHSELYQTANLGYIYHNYLYQGGYINTGIGYDFKFKFGLKVKSNLEVGYLHTFTTRDEYQFKDGEYKNRADKGNPRVMMGLSLGLGYKLKRDVVRSSEIFILYKSWIEYPYSPGFIPLMSHINLELGYKFYLNSRD